MDKPSEAAMRERPLLFTPAMAAAVYAGTKTQTRRVIKNNARGADRVFWTDKAEFWPGRGEPYVGWVAQVDKLNGLHLDLQCPYGVPGDRLWVRESIAWDESEDGQDLLVYRDGETWSVNKEAGGRCHKAKWKTDAARRENLRWTPNIHAPRWTCRSVLEVVSVRAERVNAITPGDAIDEGAMTLPNRATYEAECASAKILGSRKPPLGDGPVQRFARLWDEINGAGSFESGPWVWVVEFRKLSPLSPSNNQQGTVRQ